MTFLGISTTILYILALLFFRWDTLSELQTNDLNELGDFLAGVFGPVTIFWLILGFLQQGKELKQSTNALQLQAEELNNSVAQQKDLVILSREQINNAKEQERINRSLNEIEGLLLAIREVEESKLNKKNINIFCNKIEWIISIKGHDLKDFFKYDLLMRVLLESSVQSLLSSMRENLMAEVDYHENNDNLQDELEHANMGEEMGVLVYYSKEAHQALETDKLFTRVNTIIEYLDCYQKDNKYGENV